MAFGFSSSDADGDGSVGDQIAARRLDPMSRMRRAHTLTRSALPESPQAKKAMGAVPTPPHQPSPPGPPRPPGLAGLAGLPGMAALAKPAGGSSAVPSHADVHAHLDNAKAATSDGDKRMHVFKALTALNRRQKAVGSTPMPDMGAS